MKLYATVTSERATKGQGGNNFLRIELTIGDGLNPKDIGAIELVNVGDERYQLRYYPTTKHDGVLLTNGNFPQIEKGKRQKGNNNCYAQVGEEFCGKATKGGDYCEYHTKMFGNY